MARPKKIEEESQENIVEAPEVSEVKEDTKVEEVVPAEEPAVVEEPTVVEEPAAAEPVKEEAAVEGPAVEEPKATEKPAKKSKKSEKIAEVKEPIADTSKKAAIASDAKSFVVSSIPAYMAPNVNSAFGLISGLFIADGEVTNGAGLSFTAGYTPVPGAGGKVKIYVKTSDLK